MPRTRSRPGAGGIASSGKRNCLTPKVLRLETQDRPKTLAWELGGCSTHPGNGIPSLASDIVIDIFDVMLDISARIVEEARRRAGLTQRDLAALAGTSQAAIARMERGLVSPTLGTLLRVAAAAGFELKATLVPLAPADPVIEAYKRDVDRSLLRENLKRSVDQRIRSLIELEEFGNELGRAGRKARRR